MEMKKGWEIVEVAQKVANDIPNGSYVNLGIGIPELVAGLVPEGREVIYHTENGLLGMGPPPEKGKEDPELINAGKKCVTTIPGACYFHHADSFMMIRGGHIDYCILGAYQVSEEGDLANWSTGEPGAVPAVVVATRRQLPQRLQLTQRLGQVQLGEAVGLRHVVEQVLDALDACCGQHFRPLGVGVGNEWHLVASFLVEFIDERLIGCGVHQALQLAQIGRSHLDDPCAVRLGVEQLRGVL